MSEINIVCGISNAHSAFVRLAVALFMDSTDGHCCKCGHEYLDVDAFIEKDPILVSKGEINKVACKACYNKGWKNDD